MKKYYLAHIDFAEIVNVTADTEQLSHAKERMTELGMLTEKGNPATGTIGGLVESTSRSFFTKLQRRLRYRSGGVTAQMEQAKRRLEEIDASLAAKRKGIGEYQQTLSAMTANAQKNKRYTGLKLRLQGRAE